MIYNIIQTILVLLIFFPTKYLAFKITEEWGMPEWLRYQPWECRKCLSFWSLMALYASCGLLLHLWITMAVGAILTVLDTVAVIVDQRKKTIKVEDTKPKIIYSKLDNNNNIIIETNEMDK